MKIKNARTDLFVYKALNYLYLKRFDFFTKLIIFLLIMHYDAITHTRKAIRNLQSEVRLFLRKQN